MFKKERGITWIALVVTIIVLLILAGVAISLTIGQGGLFQRAENAAETWRNASTNEEHASNEFDSSFDSVYNQYVTKPNSSKNN